MKPVRLTVPALLAALASPAVPATPPTPAAPPPIPVETLADRPFLSSPVLSPDGRRLAATTDVGGKASVMIFDVDDLAKRRKVALGDASVGAMSWAGADRLLVTYVVRSTMFGVEVPVARLAVVDVAAATARPLDAKSHGLFAGDVLYTAPDGGWILVSSQDSVFVTPSVKRIDLATGVAVRVEPPRADVWNWFADGDGVVRAGVAYRGERWTIWYRETAGAPLKALRGRADADRGAVDGIRFFGADQRGLIITDARTGRFAAYRYDFATGAIGEPVYEHPQVDITGVVVTPGSSAVLGIRYEDDRRRVNWLDPAMRAVQARVDHVFPGAENIILGASADGNRELIWSGSASDPGAYYVLDNRSRRMMSIVAPYEKLSDVRLSPVTPVSYPARDGLAIPAYLTLPAGRAARDLPLIVYPHGGPFARDSWSYDPFVQLLASRGYAVLQPNFRGSTGYGKAYVERGYGQFGRAMQDDLDDGMDWLVRSGQVDRRRVCIMGASYGGYAALWGAIRNPERYRCAISLAGVTDLPGMLRYDRRSFSAPRYFREWQNKVRGDGGQDLDAVSPLAQAARLSVPVLIAHGEKDGNVPPRQAHEMVAALQRRHADVESVFYPEEGHGLSERDDLIDFMRRVERFLARHNPS